MKTTGINTEYIKANYEEYVYDMNRYIDAQKEYVHLGSLTTYNMEKKEAIEQIMDLLSFWSWENRGIMEALKDYVYKGQPTEAEKKNAIDDVFRFIKIMNNLQSSKEHFEQVYSIYSNKVKELDVSGIRQVTEEMLENN